MTMMMMMKKGKAAADARDDAFCYKDNNVGGADENRNDAPSKTMI